MTRLAYQSLTAATASADRARAAVRVFLTTTDEAEAESLYDAAVDERSAAENAASDAYDEHRSRCHFLADHDEETSGWYDAHCAWETAAKLWNSIPDSWES